MLVMSSWNFLITQKLVSSVAALSYRFNYNHRNQPQPPLTGARFSSNITLGS